MTNHYYLWCPKCRSASPDSVFVTFNGVIRKDDYGMGGRSEVVRTSDWLEEHQKHAFGELILLHEDDERLCEDNRTVSPVPKSQRERYKK